MTAAGLARRAEHRHGAELPRLLLAVLSVHASLLLLYVVLSPAWQPPDEQAHGDLVLAVLDVSGYPDEGRHVSAQVLASRSAMSWSKDATDRLPSEAPPRPRATFAGLADDVPTDQLNAATQHPPLYYVATAAFTGAVTGAASLMVDLSHDQVLLVMRLFNVLMILPLPYLAYRAARRLDLSEAAALVSATACVAIPQLTYIGGAVNNDNPVVLAFGVLSLLLARVATGDVTQRTAFLVGVVSGAASLSKVFGLATIPWVIVVYGIVIIRRRFDRAAVVAGATAGSVALVLGGFWWLRNLVTAGALQPLARDRSPRPGFVPDALEWLQQYGSRMIQSFWGRFGYLDVPIAGWMAVTGTVVALVLVIIGAARRRHSWTVRLAVLLLPVLLVVLGNAVQHWATIYPRLGGFGGSQGRYLFAAVVPAAVLAGMAVEGRHERGLLAVVAVGLVVLHASSLHALLHAFWGLEEGIGHATRNVLAWSPLPAGASIGLLAVIVAAPAVAIRLARGADSLTQPGAATS